MIERTLVQIRERSAVDLLDLSLVVARRRPAALGLAALAGIAPWFALNAWLFRALPDLDPVLAQGFWMLEAPLATAPLTIVLGGLMFGRRPGPASVVVSLLKAAFPLIVVHGVLRFVVCFWTTSRLFFANEVILLERGRWWRLMGRGRDLASGRAGELFVLGVFQLAMTYLFALLAYLGVSAIVATMVSEDVTWELPEGEVFKQWPFQAPLWLATAFFAVARFLTYIDQRIRLEGWEVELRLRDVGEAMQEARRW